MVRIRRVRPDNWPDLRSVRLAALADAPYAFLTPHDEAAAYPDEVWQERSLHGSSGSGQATFLLYDGNEVCGMVTGLARADGDVLMVGMWVAPGHRSAGHGGRMVRHLVGWARDTGATSVTLGVTEGNEAARALYLSCGFRFTGQVRTFPKRPHLAEHTMRLQLSG